MVHLVLPSVPHLPGYVAALETGWSPSNTRDISAEQLAAIRADAAAFLAGQARETGGEITLEDGRMVPRLPQRIRWIMEGDVFAGSINLRHQPGTLALPAHVSGHVGYAVVPWMRRRGIATAALRQMLAIAATLGLPRVLLTCDTGNAASRGVIVNAGGTPAIGHAEPGKDAFWIMSP